MSTRTIRRALKWFAVLALGFIVISAILAINVVHFRPFSINVFYERVFFEQALRDPEQLSQLRLLEPYGITAHNDDLTDASPSFARSTLEKAKRDLATLRSYERDNQTSEQLLSTDILAWYLDDVVRGEPFLFYNYPVNQFFGVQNDLPTFMATIHQVNNGRDAEQYVARLGKFDEKFDQVIEGLELRERMGIIPPRFVIDRVLTEMEAFATTRPAENILYTSFEEKLSKVESLSARQRSRFLQQASDTIEKTVYPAYRAMSGYFRRLREKATDDDGVWKFPNGDAFYAYVLRSQTTTNLTPEEVHQVGLAEVDRIIEEMKSVLDSLGHKGKPVGELVAELQDDPRFKYPGTREGRTQCIEDYQSLIDTIDRGLGDAFDVRPTVGVQVQRIPEFREKTAPGAYYNPPSLDGSRPGIFYVNLRDMNDIVKWAMPTLAYHEAIPGHHFQLAIQQQVTGPTFRKVVPFTAFMEGWALYAERLAWELGFEQDPQVNLGRLRSELFRAARLVVDTGIHCKRWTRRQAIDYMIETTGMAENDVVSEVERYIVSPGQACSYTIGQITILQLRTKARTELGPAFSLKEFHDAVLTSGAMPLEILEPVVDRYIASSKALAARTDTPAGSP